MANSDSFSIYFHHGGNFILHRDEYVYSGSKLSIKHGFDADRFGYFDLVEEVEKLGYALWDSLRWKVPKTGEYKVLNDDREVIELIYYIMKSSKPIISVYVDNGSGNIDEELIKQTNIEHVENCDDKGDHFVQEMLVESNDQESWFECDIDEPNDEMSDSSKEDKEYFPMSERESETDDEMNDDELASDEEYIDARNNKNKEKLEVLGLHEISIFNGSSIAATEAIDIIECQSDYADSNEDVNSETSGDEELDTLSSRKMKRARVNYDPKCDHKTLKLVIGMRFESPAQCKHAIRTFSIMNGHPIRFTRSSKTQVEAKCIPVCGWRFYGSVVKSDKSFLIKRVSDRHICPRDMHNKQATPEWIAKEYLETFRARPDLKIKELEHDIMKRFACQVPIWRLYRAREMAREVLRGSHKTHYAKLRSYVAELYRVDPEGRFELQVGENGVFKSFYVGISGLRKGFLAGCRRLIGLDGCFLKTAIGGVLLTAVGKDGNNQMFPIAWAVVEVENEQCWSWFLRILFEELGMVDGLGITIISDQQKGLENAVSVLVPHAEHRNCARHVYCNWKKMHKGPTLKNMFWKIVRSTYNEAYKLSLDELRVQDEDAYQNFINRETKRFCKAFISPYPLNDMIDNNISETFNGFILHARGKPITDMLEEIRNSLMNRQYAKLVKISGSTDKLCPMIKSKIEQLKYDSRHCKCTPALGGKFQVSLHDEQFVVNIGNRSCTCRVWNLTGIPCLHACSAIAFLKEEATDFVADCYAVSRYIEAYRFGIEPTNGPKMWPPTTGYPIQPPLVRKMPGRPKKNRTKSIDEKKNGGKNNLGILHSRMTCQRCLQEGHNKRSCKNAPVNKPPQLKVKRGRPFKNAPNVGVQKMAARKRASQPTTTNTNIARERRMVKTGLGVLVFEDTGNIYKRMGRQVEQVRRESRGRGASRGRGVSGRGNLATTSSGDKGGAFATQESHA